MARAALCAAGLLACGPGWAGRPLATEDAGVLAKGGCESESFAGRQWRPGISLVSTQLGCGLAGDTQLGLGVSREAGGNSRTRYVTLGGKTALRALGDTAPGVALAYTLLGGAEQTDYMKYVGAEIKGVVTLPWRGWLLHGNAGLQDLRQDRDRRVTWALAAERPAAIGPVDLMGEIYGNDRDSPWVQVAARWTALPGRLYIDASCGIQTNGAHTRLATLGMKLAF